MKKLLSLIYLGLVLLVMPVQAQTTSDTYKTAHYEFTAEAGAESSLDSLARDLELRFEVYNSLFRFDPAALPEALKVRVFIDQASYDAYVNTRLGYTRSGAVYLHYNNYERRELAILRSSPDEAAMLAHQSFVQFLRAFIPNPPAWMLEGFGIYFNSLRYDPEEQTLLYEENLSWLESVKALGNSILYPRQLLGADIAANEVAPAVRTSRDFQICAWAFVSFLLYSGDHFRTLTESFMLLSSHNTAEENSTAVMNRFSLWSDFDSMDSEYAAYLDSRKTFAELMENGRNYYNAGNAMMAELSFMTALDQRPNHYAPYYYLGLIYYEEKLYEMAEQYYLMSIECGADEALVSYALGVNAASAGRINDALTWLERAASLDPARYQSRAEDMIQRLR